VNSGIVAGRSNTDFDPNTSITRAEMATMAANALKTIRGFKSVIDVDAAVSIFSDATVINSALKPGVAIAVRDNLMVGFPSGKFEPNAVSTRAQAAIVLYRLLNAE